MPRKQRKTASNERLERDEQVEHAEQPHTDRSRPIGKKEQNRVPGGSSPDLSKITLESERDEHQDIEQGSTVQESVHDGVQDSETSDSPNSILTPGMVAAMRKARKERGWSIRRVSREWGVAVGTAHKAVADVVPLVVPEPEEEDAGPPTGPAPLNPVHGADPGQPQPSFNNEQLLSPDAFTKIISAMVSSEVPPEGISAFLERLENHLQNSNGSTPPPRIPRISSEVTGLRPRILEANNGPEPNGTSEIQILNDNDPKWRLAKALLVADALRVRASDPVEYVSDWVLPDIALARDWMPWVPGETREQKTRNFHRAMLHASRYLELREKIMMDGKMTEEPEDETHVDN